MDLHHRYHGAINNGDIGKNKKGMNEEIAAYCHLEQSCMRCLDAGLRTDEQVVGHSCCSNCSLVCDCPNCALSHLDLML